MSDLTPGTDDARTGEPSPEPGDLAGAPATATPQRRRRPPFVTLATVGRGLGPAGVALASMAVGLVGFSAAALLTNLPVADTAFRFDTTWFYRIAENGYLHRVPTGPTDYGALRVAFFPGLPFLERAVHAAVGGGPIRTTVLIGAAGLIVSCIVLFSVVAREWDDRAAWRSVVLLAFFPGAFVFPMAYSESVAIPLALVTFWALQRRWFLVAGLAAAVAGTVRLNAVVLVAVCLVAAVRQWRNRNGARTFTVVSALASPVLAGLGCLGYLIYLRSTTGNPFAFSRAEKLGWGDRISGLAPFHDLRLYFAGGFRSPPVVIMNGIGVSAVVAAVALVVFVSMPLEYKVFGIGVLSSWLLTTDSGEWFRYIEFAFPALVALAVKAPEKLLLPLVGVFAGSFALLVVVFGSSTSFFP